MRVDIELYQSEGMAIIEAKTVLCAQAEIRLDTWQRCGSEQRKAMIGDTIQCLSQPVVDKCRESFTKNIIEIRDFVEKRLGPRSFDNNREYGILDAVIRALQSKQHKRHKIKIFDDVQVTTLCRVDPRWNRSRAPFSYEFESAPMPAPPVIPDIYWDGRGSKQPRLKGVPE